MPLERGEHPIKEIAYLLGSLLGTWLPINWIFIWGGVAMYANRREQAELFLWIALIHLVVGVFILSICLVSSYFVRVRETRITFKARFSLASTWLTIALTNLGLAVGAIKWLFQFSGDIPYIRWSLYFLAVVLLSWLSFFLVANAGVQKRFKFFLQYGCAVTGVVTLAAIAIFLVDHPVGAKQTVDAATRSTAGPSVILITVDALSALHLPIYGYSKDTSPSLKEFSGQATVFLRNYSNSNFTTSSVASFLSGNRPWRHRAIQLEGKPLVNLAPNSLPAILKKAGYVTASVATNNWASPNNLGLDDYYDFQSNWNTCESWQQFLPSSRILSIALESSWIIRGIREKILSPLLETVRTCSNGRQFDPEIAFNSARTQLNKIGNSRPFFLWVHLLPPHDPYVSPAPYVGRFDASNNGRSIESSSPPGNFEAASDKNFPGVFVSRYDESIAYVDHHIGAFLDELKHRGLFDRSLIIISADHGESFTKGYGKHGGPMLHEELIRVPLLIKQPGQTEGQVVTDLSEQVDYLPTILDLADVRSQTAGEGMSLVPALSNLELGRPVFSMNLQQSHAHGYLETGSVAMLENQWKYVHYFGYSPSRNQPSLEDYLVDLSRDPTESQNLIRSHPHLAGQMLSKIKEKLRLYGAPIQ